jgi:dTDP-glucose 4,6-dehydratase
VGSNKEINITDLATLVRDTLAPEKPVRIRGTPNAQSPRHRYIPNTDKVQRQLGLRAATSLQESIRNTARAARACANEDV